MSLAPHPFTTRQLQYAIAVADARSFRRAAASCGVSQPSLSAQLSQLETALGVRLFERDRRGVLPTAAGEELIARARRVLIETDDLLGAAQRFGDPLAGRLRLGVIPTVSPYLLPEIAPALRRAHPRLDLRWIEDKTSALVARLQAGELEGALLALEAELGEVKAEVIGRDPFVLALPRRHPLARRAGPAALGELRGVRVLLLDDGHCLREQALAVCAHARADELGFRATSLPTLAQMVSAGAGVTLLPRLAVPTEGRRAALAIRPLAEPGAHRTLALVWRPASPLGPALSTLAATVRESFERVMAGAGKGGRRAR
ncbi:MAG TPA: LysR substrate-binding domain-containing protein [Polyangia bacterium]|nr:LysR substrate-binding domain-containing protein [Polyangia bacterium]